MKFAWFSFDSGKKTWVILPCSFVLSFNTSFPAGLPSLHQGLCSGALGEQGDWAYWKALETSVQNLFTPQPIFSHPLSFLFLVHFPFKSFAFWEWAIKMIRIIFSLKKTFVTCPIKLAAYCKEKYTWEGLGALQTLYLAYQHCCMPIYLELIGGEKGRKKWGGVGGGWGRRIPSSQAEQGTAVPPPLCLFLSLPPI